MKSLFIIAALAASSLPASIALSQSSPGINEAPAQGAALDNADRKFLTDAAQAGMLEVKLGQMATKQAASEDVKKFGQRMVDDHGKLNAEVTKLAATKKLTLPAALDKKHQEEVDKLAKLGGPEFDKEYMSKMVDDHQSDVNDFEHAAKDAKDPAVKALAANALPTLREHLAQAKDVESRAKQEKKP